MVKLDGIYNLRWCDFLCDCKGCRENALQLGLSVRRTAGLHHSSYSNMVCNHFYHVVVLIHGSIGAEGTVGVGAYHDISRFVKLLVPESELVFAGY